jgi:hypothetical protein
MDYLATQGIIFLHSCIIYASLFVTKLKSEFMYDSKPYFLRNSYLLPGVAGTCLFGFAPKTITFKPTLQVFF